MTGRAAFESLRSQARPPLTMSATTTNECNYVRIVRAPIYESWPDPFVDYEGDMKLAAANGFARLVGWTGDSTFADCCGSALFLTKRGRG